MHHVAIMKKSWGLTNKILSGHKKIESRWYSVKCRPWNAIGSGDTVYFKDSGDYIRIKTKVRKVMQFTNLTPKKVGEILDKYGKDDGIEKRKIGGFFKMFKNKKYCILVFLKDPKKVKQFKIDKSGFGSMSAWITTDNVSKIKK